MAKSNIFKKKSSEDVVAIDFSDNRVRLVHALRGEPDLMIKNIVHEEFNEEADEDMAAYIDKSYRELGIANRSAICVIPSRYFISKNVDMPSNDPEEISKIVDLQAGRYTPYSRDEIVIDYLCMENPGQHYTNVLLFIVNRKMIDRYIKIFDRANVYLEKIIIASEGSAYVYDELKNVVTGDEPVGGIHIDSDSADLTIVHHGQMSFVRSIPVGANQFKDDRANAQETFINELNKSLMAFQDQGAADALHELILTGAIDDLEFLKEVIQSSVTGTQEALAVTMMPYADQFQMSPKARSYVDLPERISYFEMISSIKNYHRVLIDLVPKEIKLKRQFKEGGKETIALGVLIMTCLVMVCSFLGSKIYIKRDLIGQLDSVYESTSSEARLLEKASTKARVLRTLIEHRGKGIYVFDKVTSLIGENIYLQNFAYDHDGNLKLVGTAESMSGVFAFVTKLEESGYFTSVITNETKTRREANKDVADFDIDCVMIEEI